jgi:hypothetical protein
MPYITKISRKEDKVIPVLNKLTTTPGRRMAGELNYSSTILDLCTTWR